MASEFLAVEKKWQDFWKKENVFGFDKNSKLPVFSIDSPPPTVSGRMHLGHAFSYSQADFVARFKRMQGFSVFYPFGFDDNGLATERMVEKNLNVQAKQFERQKFIELCLQETRKAEELLESDFGALGLSADWSTVYRTISKQVQKTAQFSFIGIFNQERAYRKEAPSMWCPKCETAIAQAELEDEQKNSELVFIEFGVEGGKKIIIATTRPEMLPACVAIHVHPDDSRFREFVGKNAIVPFFERRVPIIANMQVSQEFGSGAVYHCTFGGQQDIEWSLAFNLPVIEIIEKNGKLNSKAGEFAGLTLVQARQKILQKLQEKKFLKKTMPITHSVNMHERCKTPIEILTCRQWFVKYLDLKKEFLQKAREINWAPEHMRLRMENWVNGLKWDWNVSRQRFFGVPIPVWYCKKCGKEILAEKNRLPVDPLKDMPLKKCICGSIEFEGEKDVFDTWFTSSLSPQIALEWIENKKFFEKLFPMSLRVQAHDIINLWAFYTIAKAFLHEKKIPWKNTMVSGHALDSKGRKMSKSLGNVVEPLKVIENFSADVLRYWAASANLGEDLAFQEKDMVSGKKFMQKLLNAAKFVQSANNEFDSNFDLNSVKPKQLKLRVTDKWILARLNQTITECTQSFEKFDYSKALFSARSFFWLEFADHYIEQTKYRVYGKDTESKKACLFALNKTMFDLLKLFAPFFPHITEEICSNFFKRLLKTKSIHLEKWPVALKEAKDKNALDAGKNLIEIISAIRKEKTARQISLNKEIAKITLYGLPLEMQEILQEIQHTMNAKEIQTIKGKGKIQANEKISLDLIF